jgi:ribonuclease-3
MPDVSPRVPPEQEPHLAALERRLGVRFRDRGRLFHALIHRSAVNERFDLQVTSNERLEFLGDAILGAVVAERLFLAYPESSEGRLTVLRALLVCEPSLAGWARALDLGRYLVLGRGEELGGARDRDALLASAFEAVVGAMYLDYLDQRGRGLRRIATFLERFIVPDLERLKEGPLFDAKSRLQQRSQAERDARPSYRVVTATGPEHSPTFTVEVAVGGRPLARGEGPSKRTAEQAAAAAALDTWDAPDAPDAPDTQLADGRAPAED